MCAGRAGFARRFAVTGHPDARGMRPNDPTVAYADALRTFASRLIALVEATPDLSDAQLEALAEPPCARGVAAGFEFESVVEQVSNTVRFLRTEALDRPQRHALAQRTGAAMRRVLPRGEGPGADQPPLRVGSDLPGRDS